MSTLQEAIDDSWIIAARKDWEFSRILVVGTMQVVQVQLLIPTIPLDMLDYVLTQEDKSATDWYEVIPSNL